jgi:hypothetical protein
MLNLMTLPFGVLNPYFVFFYNHVTPLGLKINRLIHAIIC